MPSPQIVLVLPICRELFQCLRRSWHLGDRGNRGMLRMTPNRVLKKGTGSDRTLAIAGILGLPRGACPLFQHPANQQSDMPPSHRRTCCCFVFIAILGLTALSLLRSAGRAEDQSLAAEQPATSKNAPAPAEAIAGGADSSIRIARLVELLGSQSYLERTDASQKLAELGGVSRGALEAAATADDPEVRLCAAELLKNLKTDELVVRRPCFVPQPARTGGQNAGNAGRPDWQSSISGRTAGNFPRCLGRSRLSLRRFLANGRRHLPPHRQRRPHRFRRTPAGHSRRFRRCRHVSHGLRRAVAG